MRSVTIRTYVSVYIVRVGSLHFCQIANLFLVEQDPACTTSNNVLHR